MKNPVTPPGIDSGTVRLVEQSLNHYVTPGLVSCEVSTPVTGRAGPEGSKLLGFLVTAQYSGRLSALRTGRLYSQD
jgi:hypothetical protein